MLLATVNEELMPPSPGLQGLCPDFDCGGKVCSKCGDKTEWHWAHLPLESSPTCCYRAYGEGEWHLKWKGLAPGNRREVQMGAHRADMASPDGFVVEIQSSSIASGDLLRRERHYGRMAWIVNCTANAASFIDCSRYRDRFLMVRARGSLRAEIDKLTEEGNHLSEENERLLVRKQGTLNRLTTQAEEAPRPSFKIEHGWDARTRRLPQGRITLPSGAWGTVAKRPVFLDFGESNPCVLLIDRRSVVSNGSVKAYVVNRLWFQVMVSRVMHGQIEPPPILAEPKWDGVMDADYRVDWRPKKATGGAV